MATTKQASFAHTAYTNYGTTIVTAFTEARIVISVIQQLSSISPCLHRHSRLFPISYFLFLFFVFFLVMILVKPSVLGLCGEIQRL
jgi:hypothetical protein